MMTSLAGHAWNILELSKASMTPGTLFPACLLAILVTVAA